MILYVENWLANGDIRTHVANDAGRPLCGTRCNYLHPTGHVAQNSPCFRCHRLCPGSFPGEFSDTPEADAWNALEPTARTLRILQLVAEFDGATRAMRYAIDDVDAHHAKRFAVCAVVGWGCLGTACGAEVLYVGHAGTLEEAHVMRAAWNVDHPAEPPAFVRDTWDRAALETEPDDLPGPA